MFIASKNVVLFENGKYVIRPALIQMSGLNIAKVEVIENPNYNNFIKETQKKQKIEIHDYQDRLISPAFVNAHTHIAMNFFRAVAKNKPTKKNMMEDVFFKIESKLTQEDVSAFARVGAYENILCGNGLVWDHYYHGYAIAKACVDVGLTAVVAPTLQDISGPGVSLWKQALHETKQIDAESAFSSQGVFAALGPHATDTVSAELFKHCVTLSKEWNIPIHCHAAQSFEEVQMIKRKHKTTPMVFLESLGVLQNPAGTLLAHGIHLTKKDFASLKKGNTALVFCPFSQMVFQFPADVMEWEKSKCNWFVATDCVASNASMNVQKELQFIAGFSSLKSTFSDVTSKQKTYRSTKNPFLDSSFLLNKVLAGPGSFHPKFKAGVIAPGALANLVIWETSHPAFWPPHDLLNRLAQGDTTNAIHNMFVAGKKKSKDGEFVQGILNSSDYKESVVEADKRLKGLL